MHTTCSRLACRARPVHLLALPYRLPSTVRLPPLSSLAPPEGSVCLIEPGAECSVVTGMVRAAADCVALQLGQLRCSPSVQDVSRVGLMHSFRRSCQYLLRPASKRVPQTGKMNLITNGASSSKQHRSIPASVHLSTVPAGHHRRAEVDDPDRSLLPRCTVASETEEGQHI